MTDANDFLWGHAPFWIAIYALGIVTWSCVGRFLLAWFVPAIHPTNYIWRGFVFVTEWAVRLCALVTPRYVRPMFMPLVTFFWLYWFVRPLVFVAFVAFGLAPRGIVG
jgi:hypothetical protein